MVGNTAVAQVLQLPPVNGSKSSADISAPDISKLNRQKPPQSQESLGKVQPKNNSETAQKTSKPKGPLIPKELSHLALENPLTLVADSVMQVASKEMSEEGSVTVLKGLSTIASTCLAIYGGELKYASEQAQLKTQTLSTELRRRLTDQADMYVAAFMRVMFIAQQSSALASTDSIDQIHQSLKQESQMLVNRSAKGLISMKFGDEQQQKIYNDRFDECRGFLQSKGSPYKRIFTDFLY